MNDGLERATARRNIFERLVSKIPGLKSYIERETRRDVDKMQRDWLAGQVDRCRQSVQSKVRDWTRAGNLSILSDAASLEKLLDRFANRIRHADYGYTGFFDAVKIREDELDQLYEFDLQLTETVESLALQVDNLPEGDSDAEVRAVLDAVAQADRAFDERSTIFEDVTQKGA